MSSSQPYKGNPSGSGLEGYRPRLFEAGASASSLKWFDSVEGCQTIASGITIVSRGGEESCQSSEARRSNSSVMALRNCRSAGQQTPTGYSKRLNGGDGRLGGKAGTFFACDATLLLDRLQRADGPFILLSAASPRTTSPGRIDVDLQVFNADAVARAGSSFTCSLGRQAYRPVSNWPWH
jgi:hypothetical protein